jgi:hypothetical protein
MRLISISKIRRFCDVQHINEGMGSGTMAGDGARQVLQLKRTKGHAFIQADGLPELRGANGDRGDDRADVQQPWPASVCLFGLRRHEKRLDRSRAMVGGCWFKCRGCAPASDRRLGAL